jgi:competence transcription factor ComK
MNAIAFQNLIPTLENSSKSCDHFDPLFIKQIKKLPNVETLLEIESLKKCETYIPFVFLNKQTPNVI